MATGIGAGPYNVTVTDINGCTNSATATVRLAPSTPISITGQTTICPGGSASLRVTQGLVSYQWSSGDTTAILFPTLAGNYSVIGTNANNCTSSANINVINGSLPSSTITGSDHICSGSFISLCAPGGMRSYLWNTGSRTNCINIRNGGRYTVTVMIGSGDCTRR